MPYYILIKSKLEPKSLLLDKVLGSAFFVETYWESVGRKLNLPIISSITNKADSENGFVLEGDSLLKFKQELKKLDAYWLSQDKEVVAPESFFVDIDEVRSIINTTGFEKIQLIIG